MLEDVTRTQAPEADGGTRTFGVAGGTASFPNGPRQAESVTLPSVPGFEILDLVGRGGMGLVFKARQLATGRIVALKMIITGELANTAARDRFRSEITATAKLSHPNIVQLFEAGEADGRAFLVCEYVEGGSLAARLDGTPWDAKRAARLIVPISRAVASAHASGIVHRDLKPANILLDTAVSPKLADFGIAKQIGEPADAATHTGAILGTPSYMAPEQAGGAKGAGPAADVYGLGAILYELLTGRPPFKGADFVETLDQVRRQEPVAPRILLPKLPRDIETICLKCLQKDPAKRYSSADTLAEDLERFLENKPIAARPVSGVERAWRWTKRNPAVSALMAAVFLVLVAGTAVSIYFAVQADAEREKAEGREKDANRARTDLALEADKVRNEQDLTRRLLYISQMNAASVAFSEGRIPRLVQILQETTPKPGEPDLRGWEWHYFERLTTPEGPSIAFAEPSDPAFVPATAADAPTFAWSFGATWSMSRDGSRFIRASGYENDAFAKFEVWDVAAKRRLGAAYTVPGANKISTDDNEDPPIPVFSPDGREFAAFCYERDAPNPPGPVGRATAALWGRRQGNYRLVIWDAESGRRLPAPDLPLQLRLPGGGPIIQFDSEAVAWLEQENVPPVLGFGFPAMLFVGGAFLGGGGGMEMYPQQAAHFALVRWNRKTGQSSRTYFHPGSRNSRNLLSRFSSSGYAIFNEPTNSPVFDPNALLQNECWDLRADPKRVLGVELPLSASVAFSPSGTCFATLSGSNLMLFKTQTPNGLTAAALKHVVEGPLESTQLTTVSDSGVVVLKRPNALIAVDFRSEPAQVTALHHRDGQLPIVQFAPGGEKLFTVGGDGPVRRERELRFAPQPPAFSPNVRSEAKSLDGKWVIPFGNPDTERLTLKEVATGQVKAKLPLPPNEAAINVQFLPGDRGRILVQTSRRVAEQPGPQTGAFGFGMRFSWHLFDFDGKRLGGETAPNVANLIGPSMGANPSPSGRWIVSGFGSTELSIHDSATGKLVNRFAPPGGFHVSTFKLDAPEDRICMFAVEWQGPQRAPPAASEEKPRNTWLQYFEVAGGRALWNQPVRLAQSDRGGELMMMMGRFDQIGFLDGDKRILLGTVDAQRAHAWIGNAADGTEIRTFAGPNRGEAAFGLQPFWLDRSKRLIALAGNKDVKAWNLETGEPIAELRGHDSGVTGVAFSENGRRIYTMESSRLQGSIFQRLSPRIHVWDVATSRQIITLRTSISPGDPRIGGSALNIGIRIEGERLILGNPGNEVTFDGTPVK